MNPILMKIRAKCLVNHPFKGIIRLPQCDQLEIKRAKLGRVTKKTCS